MHMSFGVIGLIFISFLIIILVKVHNVLDPFSNSILACPPDKTKQYKAMARIVLPIYFIADHKVNMG